MTTPSIEISFASDHFHLPCLQPHIFVLGMFTFHAIFEMPIVILANGWKAVTATTSTLVLEEWVLSWRLNEDSDSSDSRRAGGSRFWGHGQRNCVGRSMCWSRVPWEPQTPLNVTDDSTMTMTKWNSYSHNNDILILKIISFLVKYIHRRQETQGRIRRSSSGCF